MSVNTSELVATDALRNGKFLAQKNVFVNPQKPCVDERSPGSKLSLEMDYR